jgi:multidrug efflux pump subunit AcrA (membrane-fusion protein)
VKRENAASLSQRDADVRAKEQALTVLERRMERYQEQLAACTISAPSDGMVVYATSNDRNAQSALQEGAQVRERQNLLRLPDTSSMKAVVRINEAQVARLREGQRALIQLPNQKEPIGATLTKISVLADNSQRWFNPDLKEYPVDLTLDYTPPSLKPGMGVIANIFVERLKGVLTVPLTTIYSVGPQSWVFARHGDGVKPVPVTVGATNDTHAQIIDGLENGQELKILQIGEGQLLLERAGIKAVAPPASQPAERPREMPPPGMGGPPSMGGDPDSAQPNAPVDSQQRPRMNGGGGNSGGGGDRPRGEGRRRGGGGQRPEGAPRSDPGGSSAPGQ